MPDGGFERRLSFPLGLIAGVASIALIVACTAGLTLYVGWYAAIAVGLVVLPALVFGFGLVRGSGAVVAASVFGLAAAAIGSLELAEYREVSRGSVARDIAVEDVVHYPAATVFYFRPAAVRIECEGRFLSRDSKGRTGTQHYAAPIVSTGGPATPDVAAWAVCEEWGHCRDQWRKPFNAGIRKVRFTDDFAQAAARSAAKCGLRSLDGAALVEWVERPEARIQQHVDAFWDAVRIMTIAWLVVVVFAKAAWRLRKHVHERGQRATI